MTDAQAEPSQEPVGLAERVQVLEALVAQQAEMIAKLQAENQRLREEVAELRRRLGQTSKTSHRPPSSDGPRKPPRRRVLASRERVRPASSPALLGRP